MQSEYGGERQVASRPENRLDTRGLTKRFGPLAAVAGVDLSIPAGEAVTLVGPSGCGKTTLLRLIAGLERPDAGSIHLGARELTGVGPGDRDVAMVFQDHALYPHMTALDNIAFPLRNRGMSRANARRQAHATAERVEAVHLLDKRPDRLSGGERQRVALARAIVRTPALFLLDEPLASLDTPLRARFRDLIAALQARIGVTMLYVTHDQAEAMTMGRRVAVMSAGRILQFDTPRTVYGRPAHRDVARMIGSPPMALIEGELYADGGRSRLVFDETNLALPLASRSIDSRNGRVVLGLRPEQIRLTDDGTEARVERVEELGHEVIVRLRIGSNSLFARLDRPPEAEFVRVTVVGVASLFDATTGERIDG